jgi:hypothetical protein
MGAFFKPLPVKETISQAHTAFSSDNYHCPA